MKNGPYELIIAPDGYPENKTTCCSRSYSARLSNKL